MIKELLYKKERNTFLEFWRQTNRVEEGETLEQYKSRLIKDFSIFIESVKDKYRITETDISKELSLQFSE